MCDLRESSICRSSSFRLAPSQCILGIEGGAFGRAPGFEYARRRLRGCRSQTADVRFTKWRGGGTSLSCFLQFPYKVSQNQLTIQLILIASRVPAPSPCFLLFFCFFYVCVSHVNRIRSVEYFNYGNNKKTHCCFFFSLFLEEVLPPALLLVGITSLPLNTASATLEHGLRHSKRRREVKPRRRIATSSLMMGAPLTLHYPRWFHSLTFLMNRLPTQLVPAPNATFFFFCSAPCPII